MEQVVMVTSHALLLESLPGEGAHSPLCLCAECLSQDCIKLLHSIHHMLKTIRHSSGVLSHHSKKNPHVDWSGPFSEDVMYLPGGCQMQEVIRQVASSSRLLPPPHCPSVDSCLSGTMFAVLRPFLACLGGTRQLETARLSPLCS